jgi:hypothetical protein
MPVTLVPIETPETTETTEVVVQKATPQLDIPDFVSDNSFAIFVILAFVAYLAIKLVIRFLPLILGVGAFVAFMKLFGIA